jgi:hypothetical protein
MAAALDWLRSRQTAVVELDATPEGRPLYEQLGFIGTQRSWFIHAQVGRRELARLAQHSALVSVESLGPDRLPEIEPLDRIAFGGERLDLLRHILADGDSHVVAASDGSQQIVGYLMSRPLEPEVQAVSVRIGPWVAVTPGVAAALLLHALRENEARIVVTLAGENRRALELAAICGLEAAEDDLRMRLGLLPPDASAPDSQSTLTVLGRPDWIYAMTSPMVG